MFLKRISNYCHLYIIELTPKRGIRTNYSKRALYITISFIGLITIVGGLFPYYIETYLLPKGVILINNNWILGIGFVFAFLGLLLVINSKKSYKRHSTIEIFLIAILFSSMIFTFGWLYGQYENTKIMSSENIEKMKEQLLMKDNMESDNPFYSKKVIVRDDDIGNFSYIQSVRWLSDLCIKKNIKVTYAVIPAELISNPETVTYLNTLDRTHFEFAAHGYEHTIFKDLPYDKQYNLIENATDVIENNLNYRPFTFVPPKGSGDINTTKACKFLGYHSITDVIGSSYVIDFTSDFEWEKSYDPISHHEFKDLKDNFDKFYNSSDEYYIIYLHDWTFLEGEQQKLSKQKIREFEKAINYMKTNEVQFFTIEEAYRWKIDEPNIRTFKIDEQNYSIDLTECRYNHTIRFHSPLNVNGSILLTDMNTNDKIYFSENTFEFEGLKAHWYIISIPSN